MIFMRKIIMWSITLMIVSVLTVFSCMSENAGNSKNNKGRSVDDEIAFVYVSRAGGMVGGKSADSTSYYLNANGFFQYSETQTDGVMHVLEEGDDDSRSFFTEAERCLLDHPRVFLDEEKPGPEGKDEGQNLELREYYPPQTEVCYVSPQLPDIVCKYFPDAELPGPVRELVARIEGFYASADLERSNPGLYARAQRMPQEEIEYIVPDLIINSPGTCSEGILADLLQKEMRLVRIGGEDDTVSIHESLTLHKGKAAYVQFGETVFLLMTYSYENGDKQ